MIIRHKSHVKLIVAIVLGMLVIAGGASAALIHFNSAQKGSTTNSATKSTNSTIKTTSSDKSNNSTNSSSSSSDNSTDPNIEPSKNITTNNTANNTSSGNTITGSVIYATVNQGINIQITQNVTSGTCTLSLTGATSTIQSGPQSSNCYFTGIPSTDSGKTFSVAIQSDSMSGTVTGTIQ